MVTESATQLRIPQPVWEIYEQIRRWEYGLGEEDTWQPTSGKVVRWSPGETALLGWVTVHYRRLVAPSGRRYRNKGAVAKALAALYGFVRNGQQFAKKQLQMSKPQAPKK